MLGADRATGSLVTIDEDVAVDLDGSIRATLKTRAHPSTADWIGFVVSGDSLEPGAWERCLEVAAANPDAGLIYGDASLEIPGGSQALHRPAWSPQLLWSQMYIRGLFAVRVDQLIAAMGTPAGDSNAVPISGLHDLVLRVAYGIEGSRSAQPVSVVSIPSLLCRITSQSTDRPDAVDLAALDRHFVASGLAATATLGPHRTARFRPSIEDEPLVSVVVPTGGTIRRVRGVDIELVSNAVQSVVDRSTYRNIEIVVIIDHKSPDSLGERLKAIEPRVVVVRDTRPFNFAATANLAVERSTGSVIVLLNDDTEVVTPDWVERLIALTAIDDVGAVGVRLLYGDGRLQHGGVVARNGSADHLYHGYPGDAMGHHEVLAGTCNMLAVTGACLAVRRDHWDAVGGMNEELPLNYNDVDLCLRLSSRGWRTVFDGATTLTHLETSSRPQGSETWEHDVVRAEWGSVLWDDPFDNPNLRAVGVSQIAPPIALTRLRTTRGEGSGSVYRSIEGGLPKAAPCP